ncbi:MAG TPA: SIR2 family protein, partial [Acidimicrobiia bacterium]|nr:SIR2 family protein [Acidimicrobiia bacterium]
TLVGAELKPVDRPSVRHLHGLIPATGRSRGDVVLSEGDYYLMQDPRNSGEQLVAALLADRPCLFVGTSLDDPNLLRNLYRCSKNRERHVVLYTRQGDAVACDPEIPAPIRRAREEASRRRFASVNVEPLYADFFEQVVQFVNEVALRRELGDEYEYYGERLEAWRAEVVETLLPASPAAFRRCQEEIHGRLAALRDEVLDILDRAGLRRDGQDTLAVQVWTRARHGRELILIGYSDRVWSDAGTLARAVLDRPTPHFAVEVFCYGSPLYQRALPERPGTRWRSALGVPLILTSDPGHRLPVGAITLLSTEKFAGGLLEKLSEAPEEEAEVRTKLIDVGLGLLGSAYGSTTGAR